MKAIGISCSEEMSKDFCRANKQRSKRGRAERHKKRSLDRKNPLPPSRANRWGMPFFSSSGTEKTEDRAQKDKRKKKIKEKMRRERAFSTWLLCPSSSKTSCRFKTAVSNLSEACS